MTDSFRQAIIDHGLTAPDYIEAGKFMRFPGDGKRHSNKAGWCKLFDDQQYGIYGDHSTGLSKTWRATNYKTYTPEEKKAFALERAKAEREREQSKREAQAEAAIGANKKWESCPPEMGMHKYLMAKNVQPYKLRSDGFKIVIPMYDHDRNICSVQTIDPNGEKRFFAGGRTDGAYFPIGRPTGVLCVAEGYSTAATIHEATGHAVAVAFSCENLQPVAEMLSRKFSNTKFIICADDDHEKEINVGMENATRAAASCDGVVAIPDFKDRKKGNTDFNDMARLFGMDAVKAIINDAKDKPEEDFMSHFEVTVEEAEQYDDPEFAYENLIIKGHMSVIVAAPNAGKTTIFMNEVCPKLVQAGYRVVYINADVGQADSKSMVTHAKDNGYRLLLPDMKAGLSMNHFVDQLMEFNEQGKSFPNHVFIFDTLKKMTDVIVKQRAKELYKLLRSMTAKGATIVTLGHTNKFNDANGEPIYEGTGDLRSDFDELIYLIPEFHSDKSMTVSTKPDKVRGKFEPITFEIDDKRHVTLSDYVDVSAKLHDKHQLDNDSPAIELITASINKKHFIESQIRQFCSDGGIGWRTIKGVLRRYTGRFWKMDRAFQNNAKQYYLMERTP